MMMFRNRLAAAIVCAWLGLVNLAVAGTRPATLDDVLSMRTYGNASFSPDGTWIVLERQRAYDSAPRYDLGIRSGWATTELLAAKTINGALEPLFSAREGEGYLLGPWSPDGARLIVYRLVHDRFEAGVATVADRSVQWTGLMPDWPHTGLGAVWLDRDRIALTLRSDGRLPLRFRFDAGGEEVMQARWRATRAGTTPSRLVLRTRDGAVFVDETETPKSVVVLSAPFVSPRILLEGPIRDIEPSPDGRTLAVLMSGDPAPQRPEERAVQSAVLNRTTLSFVDTSSGHIATPEPDADVAPHLLRWSEDSSGVLVWRRNAGQTWRQGRLAAVGPSRTEVFNITGLNAANVDGDLDEFRPVRADWMGRKPILYARDGERADWWALGASPPRQLTSGIKAVSGRLAALSSDHFLLFSDQQLWRVGENGKVQVREGAPLRPGEPADPLMTLRTRVNGTPKRNWAIGVENGSTVMIDGAAQWGDAPSCPGRSKTIAASEQAFAILCAVQGVETVQIVASGGARILDQVNSQFAALDLARPVTIPHENVLGRQAQSLLFMPPATAKGRIKGLIVLIYPGGLDDGSSVDGLTLHMGLRPQLLAMGGYAVLSADIPGAAENRDERFGDDLARGVEMAVQAALTIRPELRGAQIAIAGHSFGGYGVLAVATHSERYAAFVAWAAPTDPLSHWGEPSPGGWLWPSERLSFNQAAGGIERGQMPMRGTPWTEMKAYLAASPALDVERINAPVLLLTADRDYVPSTQSQRLFAGLRRQGKPAQLVTYWGEGHDNASPANIRDAYEQIFSFLDESFAARLSGAEVEPPTP